MKICTKCGEEKNVDEFSKDRSKKDGLHSWCKKCKRLVDIKYVKDNKEKMRRYRKEYARENKEKIKKYMKIYRKKNKERRKKYIKQNKHKIVEQTRKYGIKYREKNKSEIKKRKIRYNNLFSKYNTYTPQISFCEKVRRDPDDNTLLQVRCTESDCKKWFNPTNLEVKNRIQSLNEQARGENRFYCSEECKEICCLYNRNKYPIGFNKHKDYRQKSKYLTNYNYGRYKFIINPNNLKRSHTEYQIDHIYSVQDGWQNNIPIEIISSPINLRMLSAEENNLKRDRSDFTKEELCELYNQFNKEEEIWNNNST